MLNQCSTRIAQSRTHTCSGSTASARAVPERIRHVYAVQKLKGPLDNPGLRALLRREPYHQGRGPKPTHLTLNCWLSSPPNASRRAGLRLSRSTPSSVSACWCVMGCSVCVSRLATSVTPSASGPHKRVELGTLVACTAFRNPALLVKIATALDEVSGGRFTLGVGAGWNEVEFRAFGLPFDHQVDRFAEALAIIAPLLREGRADVAGRYYAAPGCADLPRGPRPGGPKLLVGATGERMLRLAAQ
jgi:hypothetical protein